MIRFDEETGTITAIPRQGSAPVPTGVQFRVFDIHSHYAGDPDRFDEMLRPAFEAPRGKQTFRQRIVGRDPDALLEYLNSEGVDCAGVMADESYATHRAAENNMVLGYCNQEPSRLLAIGSINTHVEGNAARRVRRLIRGGIRALKIYASDLHMNPAGKELWPVYEVLAEDNLPVMFHTGSHSRNPYAYPAYGDPSAIEPMIKAFPTLPVVMCHSGKGGYENKCLRMASEYPNVYLELADLGSQWVSTLVTEQSASRIVFGTDMPQFSGYGALLLRVLKLRISNEAKQKVLYDNAARLMKIDHSTLAHGIPPYSPEATQYSQECMQ
jgi:predicted TIM-barrel fold metal-dependent hydrolase